MYIYLINKGQKKMKKIAGTLGTRAQRSCTSRFRKTI